MSDRHFRPDDNKGVVGKNIDGVGSQMITTETNSESIFSARVTVQRNMIDVADGKMLTKLLGLDWATVGDGPTEQPIKSAETAGDE
jgi:hypothetical protein